MRCSWQLASANPTRGVALGYDQLSDSLITAIPFGLLVEDGFLFIWVINSKLRQALDMITAWGFTLADSIDWVKQTVNRRLAKSHGFYLQHSKESLLVCVKGNPRRAVDVVLSDVILAERRGQSQKPTELYELIEEFIPNGAYLEIFGTCA